MTQTRPLIRLSNPKVPSVVIKDDRALALINPTALRKYITAAGWTCSGSSEDAGCSFFSHPKSERQIAVFDDSHTPADHAYSNSHALSALAEVASRSELLVYWDILDAGACAPTRTAAVVSGETLNEIYRLLNVNVEGLEFCHECDCLDRDDCSACDECRDDENLDCDELRQTNEILRIIGSLSYRSQA